jgi:hypothetical protein
MSKSPSVSMNTIPSAAVVVVEIRSSCLGDEDLEELLSLRATSSGAWARCMVRNVSLVWVALLYFVMEKRSWRWWLFRLVAGTYSSRDLILMFS